MLILPFMLVLEIQCPFDTSLKFEDQLPYAQPIVPSYIDEKTKNILRTFSYAFSKHLLHDGQFFIYIIFYFD